MEAFLYLIGMTSFFNPEVEQDRTELVNELKEKFHRKKIRVLNDPKDPPVKYGFSKVKVATILGIAENPNTNPHILNQLARHEEPEVRIGVADNPSTPFSTLLKLSGDESEDVRYAMAENHNLQGFLLARLQNDDNPYVSVRANKTLERLAMQK